MFSGCGEDRKLDVIGCSTGDGIGTLTSNVCMGGAIWYSTVTGSFVGGIGGDSRGGADVKGCETWGETVAMSDFNDSSGGGVLALTSLLSGTPLGAPELIFNFESATSDGGGSMADEEGAEEVKSEGALSAGAESVKLFGSSACA